MKVELSIHAVQLKNVAGAFRGTSDPFAVLTQVATKPGTKPIVLGRTEVMKNTLSPQWVSTFTCDYQLGTQCKIAVSIFDEEKKSSNKPMGCAVFEVGELLGARGNTKAKKLPRGGTVFCMARKQVGSGVLRLQVKGANLKNVEGMLSKSDPFFELSRRVDAAGSLTYDKVFRSKTIKNNLNPEWEASAIEISTLCGGNLDLPIKFSVFDFEGSGKHVAMGSFETSVKGMQQAAASGTTMHLTQKSKDVGSITFLRADVEGMQASAGSITQGLANTHISSSIAPRSQPTLESANFIDYVSGGCDLNVVVAIDFTGSNGDPRQPGTLHHLDPHSKNAYEKAITSIVGILEAYDSDKMFPVVGFGAKYHGVVNHCFQCGPMEEVHGIDGVLTAYNQVFHSGLVMSSPTVFTGVIEMAAARAHHKFEDAKRRNQQAYTVLLIITDGAVSDPAATAASIRQISDAPLSIVIVGVGDADFSSMHFLDDEPKAKRDIVQFVEYNKHSRNSCDLSTATLCEIPAQVERYFKTKGIGPLPMVVAKEEEVFVEDEREVDLTLNISEDEIVVTSGGDDFASGF
ncbi:hypothetical protein MPSEU_000369300 [Mayamaea pseudoterrestris]|nr:hypothetical protein MPSEU_000369300 [Mayamaea pseudoterrestris]